MTLVFLITTLICGGGWIINSTALKVLVGYMKEKDYAPPSDNEIRVRSVHVLKEKFHIK